MSEDKTSVNIGSGSIIGIISLGIGIGYVYSIGWGFIAIGLVIIGLNVYFMAAITTKRILNNE